MANFKDIIGQEQIKEHLQMALSSGKISHAYIINGERFAGKEFIAKIFAMALQCEKGGTEPCGECHSCKQALSDNHPDIIRVTHEKPNSIGVDDIRTQINGDIAIKPYSGPRKIYIVNEAEKMTVQAQNALLKTLEEPPRHAIFILATTEKHKILPTILSRCQIYDFNRIGVEDTVAHLAYVASKEGITAEPEALNVIALKADGGMRDALSIFDQVVSFTGGHISYKSVIENLNVLDYEYYFRLTDHFLSNQVSDALLLLNDVLNKGFDASHFVTGLSSHFRDLLVSKDPATLALLEVGASIRERYQSQAQKCPLPFLYRAMKLCNDCDLNYRASKNKRLLVELTLIQVAQLTAEGDDAGDGRGPKQSIKPIFSQPAAAQQPKAANALPQQQATTAAPAQPRPVQQAPAARATSLSPEVQQAFSSQTTMRPTPTAVLMAQGKEEKKIPVMKMSGLGVSIKHPRVDEEQQKRTVSTVQQNAQPEEDFIFNEKDVNYYWQEYAGRLPQEQTALAKRMQVIRLTMLDATTFEVVVENDIAAKEFTDLIPTLQGYLRKRLKNSKATMTVRVSAPTEKVRAYSRVEKFQLMAQKNNALLQLKDEFGLELY